MNWLTWIGIAFCISQSALFSGLNLAVFGVSRLRLEVATASGSTDAMRLQKLRNDPNFLLTTILWGNVGVNVLLTLLSDSVLAGVGAFLFSTVAITFVGEIIPQAYFSRNALRMASLLSPVLRFYQVLLFPVAKPVALILDLWLGKEGVGYYREKDMRQMIKHHISAHESDVDKLEGIGALNFLDIDDLLVHREGEDIDPASIIELDIKDDGPVLPRFDSCSSDPFLRRLEASSKKWIIVVGPEKKPEFVIDADGFLRGALFSRKDFDPRDHIKKPIVVTDPNLPLGRFIIGLNVYAEYPGDDVVDDDVILLWCANVKKIITGADILGRLLRGIVRNEKA